MLEKLVLLHFDFRRIGWGFPPLCQPEVISMRVVDFSQIHFPNLAETQIALGKTLRYWSLLSHAIEESVMPQRHAPRLSDAVLSYVVATWPRAAPG